MLLVAMIALTASPEPGDDTNGPVWPFDAVMVEVLMALMVLRLVASIVTPPPKPLPALTPLLSVDDVACASTEALMVLSTKIAPTAVDEEPVPWVSPVALKAAKSGRYDSRLAVMSGSHSACG